MNHFYDQYLYTMESCGFAEVTRKTCLKHWATLSTTYSSGLRVSELIYLRVTDINSADMRLHTIRELMGHASLTSTTIYLHVTQAQVMGLKSPQDMWAEESAKKEEGGPS